MLTKRCITNVLVLMTLLVLAGGCGQCYKVTDTSTNTAYYTHDPDRTHCGAWEFRDVKTGEMVTLQSAQVEKVSKCDCKREKSTGCEKPCGKPCPKTAPCGGAM